jgi:predicted metal-dependent peptidase
MSNKPDKTAEQMTVPYILDCAKCKSQIEKETARRIFERIERDNPSMCGKYRIYWQQFWKEFIGE